jgi:hypothetical protein
MTQAFYSSGLTSGAAASPSIEDPLGGARRTPLGADVLRQALGQEPTVVKQRQLVVARGAARLPPTTRPTDDDVAHTGHGLGTHRHPAQVGRVDPLVNVWEGTG